MPRGGKRPGAGRPKGSTAKVSPELREAARTYTKSAIETLGRIMRDKEAPHASRVQAASVLLDRGYGKPHQSVDMTGEITHSYVAEVPESADSVEDWQKLTNGRNGNRPTAH